MQRWWDWPGEVADLPPAEKVCVVAQSTLEPELYRQVAEAVKKRYSRVVVLDTICSSTYRRQEELKELAQSADGVVVVGGRNSANTRRLVEISKNLGTPTFHVETADELDESRMRQFRTVAVTAGASTPNWILMEVVEKLKAIEPESSSPVLRRLKQAGRFLVKSNIFLALGSAMLCLANARLMNISLDWLPYAMAFCYILSVHLFSRLAGQGSFDPVSHQKLSPYRLEGKIYVWLSVVSAVLALVFAGLKGSASFGIMLLLCILGILYRLDLPSLRLSIGGKKLSLRHIPASKDIFMALGWSIVTVFLPLVLSGGSAFTPAFFVTFASTFLLVIVRSLFLDVTDIQGDRIVGRETLPTIIGTRGTRALILTLAALQALIMLLGAYRVRLPDAGSERLYLSLYLPLPPRSYPAATARGSFGRHAVYSRRHAGFYFYLN